MPPVRSDKVRAVRTSSKQDAPSASGSTPDDWVWSALDIARRAAMADDLEHVPSIKAIAEIFTRMLERLQVSLTTCSARVTCSLAVTSSKGMKKHTKDEFYVITNEIGSLIGSVLRYAREHESASEKYKGVCNDLLQSV
jgi:hypothetical protein